MEAVVAVMAAFDVKLGPRWSQVRALLEPSWAKLGLLEGVWGPCWAKLMSSRTKLAQDEAK